MKRQFKNYKTVAEKRRSKDAQKTEVFMGCPGGGMTFSAKRKVLETMK